MKKKAIVIDIDGVLADSWNDQRECFCGDNPLGEEEYNKRIPNFPMAQWVLDMINMYVKNHYLCIIITGRPYNAFESTVGWLNDNMEKWECKINRVIFQKNLKETHAQFKLSEIQKLSKELDIEFILEDNPHTVKLLHKHGYRALLGPTLYKWEAKL